LQARRAGEAALEFQKVIARRGLVLNHVVGALAVLQLARAQAQAGRTEEARREYQLFLELWKAADRDNPVLAQANAEAQALRRR
jgi:hypothetical protein